jgi:TonB family protein
MKISYLTGESGREEKGECAINGGGEVLRLRAVQGNIQLRFADEAFLRQQELIQAQIEQEIAMQQRMMQAFAMQGVDDFNIQVRQAQISGQQEATKAMLALQAQANQLAQPAMAPRAPVVQPGPMTPPAAPLPPTEIMWMKLGELWWGGVRVDPADEETRRIHEVRPVYPEIARQSGIEGTVSMRVLINKEGNVEKVEVLSGEQALQTAAVAAVRQWRYQPFLLEEKPVPVVTVVNLEFRLH